MTDHLSRYSLVIATAKLARRVVEDAEETGEILEEKPVTIALNKVLDGEYEIEEPEEIRNL
ncbi:MAG TPA: DNA-directed RNA polymerase subunit omega [Candidatus Onthovicinus excrementipullorum]|nr:DNA-directed RNA polymerase subunit omega [Candidatus Onthovicinus excrementipullorum]